MRCSATHVADGNTGHVILVDQEFLGCPDFVIGDVSADGQRHLMFATQTQLSLLRQARRWEVTKYMDGTFKIRKEPFTQLWSIHAFLQKDECLKQVPLVFVLMSRQRAQDYVAVLRRLLEVLGDPAVEGAVMDFESACWNAVRTVLPGVDLRGCSFHSCQAVMRKVANLGLRTTYMKREGVHCFIRKLLALPFLPAT
ncbi:uncharacterized protein LOC110451153 [Mizuhopecten yessoensis]|uniref:uncharacterized protein LOC110451153 n=1 Tax=Mizuhopecten yessoensis TaxID=6573 RepID=UPI000B45996F|nr:uncharacterized protein LOC110451153 [Mizuhopecten yessoensis]